MRREIHIGTVVDNNDPDMRGGLKVRVDELVDQLPLMDEHIPASFPFAGSSVGWFFVPDVGAQVEVEVESDPEGAVEDIRASWRSALYSVNDPVPSEFQTDYPNRAGIKFGNIVVTFDKSQDILALVSGNVRLGEEAASHPVMRGDTYNSEEATLFNSWTTYLGQVSTLASTNATNFTALAAECTAPPLTPLGAKFTALATAWTTFGTQVATLSSAISTFLGNQNTWLSTKVKTE